MSSGAELDVLALTRPFCVRNCTNKRLIGWFFVGKKYVESGGYRGPTLAVTRRAGRWPCTICQDRRRGLRLDPGTWTEEAC